MLAVDWCRRWWDIFRDFGQVLKEDFGFFVAWVCWKSSKTREQNIVFSVACRDEVGVVDTTEALGSSRGFGSK